MSKDEKFEGYPWKPVQNDPRFPECNITGWCFQMFLDQERCTRLLGKSHASCDYFKRVTKSICPNAWVEKWVEQIAKGTFPRDLPDEK